MVSEPHFCPFSIVRPPALVNLLLTHVSYVFSSAFQFLRLPDFARKSVIFSASVVLLLTSDTWLHLCYPTSDVLIFLPEPKIGQDKGIQLPAISPFTPLGHCLLY